jgi:hypothetical protein
MDNLETIMQDRELVRDAVREYLVNHMHCPNHHKLKDQKQYCTTTPDCERCWDEALKNQD